MNYSYGFLKFESLGMTEEILSRPLDLRTFAVTVVSSAVLLSLGWKTVQLIKWVYQLLFCRFILDNQKSHLLTFSELKKGRAIRESERKSTVTNPDYPNGWFYLIESTALNKGQTTCVQLCGVEVAAYRTHSGKVYCVDAYCPHLGANLGVGGKVRGECIQCPFHGWKFSGADGKCVSVPGVDKIPESAHTSSWPIHEDNGVIYVWYHAEGLDPTWLPPVVPMVSSDPHSRVIAYSEHLLHCHAQEIPENGADYAHLEHVHQNNIGLGSNIATGLDAHVTGLFWSPARWLMENFTHHYDTLWQAPGEGEESHLTTLAITQTMRMFDKAELMGFKGHVNQVGPGIVNLDFHWFGNFVHGTMCQFVVPLAPQRTKLIHLVFGRTGFLALNRLGCKFFFAGYVNQAERDIVIWNHTAPRWRSLLCRTKGDEVLLKFRRWYSQFYSDNSAVKHQGEANDHGRANKYGGGEGIDEATVVGSDGKGNIEASSDSTRASRRVSRRTNHGVASDW